jgi:UDP-2,3-diacylglucosamine hydrolase
MSLLLISDLHLQPTRPDIMSGLYRLLDNLPQDCNQLFILGDLFEYWIGDDAPLPGTDSLADRLSRLHRQGVQIFFQAGNRDFLVGNTWLHKAGAQLLPEAFKIRFPDGALTLLMHGDQLCTDDIEYQAFRKTVRDSAWQQAFLSKSIEERIAIAENLRAESQMRGAEKNQEIMDVNQQTLEQVMEKAAVTRLIHGHTHRPARHKLSINNHPAERIVLGDWDKKGWYIHATPSGTELISFEL